MRRLVRIAGGLAACTLTALGLGLGTGGRRLYYNVSVSLPPGWYMCHPVATGTVLHRGDLVQFTPPQWVRDALHRIAPQQATTPLWMKQLAAMDHDTVCLWGDDVVINGAVVAHRVLLTTYPLPSLNGCVTLEKNDVFLLGSHAKSFDSRYTGAWDVQAIEGTCTPLWTWKEGA
jgi:type IV secretory pathway protease TraF